jgi:hypothetical protein
LTTFALRSYLRASFDPFLLEVVEMPSRMMKTKTARKVRQARKGKARKRKEQNKGTTPKFPIHID